MSYIDEHHVIAARSVSPALDSMNMFTLQVTNTGQITGSMKSGNSGSVDGKFLIEERKVWNIMCT